MSNERVMRDNLARLRGARDARGRVLEIIEVPEPARRERHDGRRLDMSYVNFYYANYGIVMPSFDDPMDAGIHRCDVDGSAGFQKHREPAIAKLLHHRHR